MVFFPLFLFLLHASPKTCAFYSRTPGDLCRNDKKTILGAGISSVSRFFILRHFTRNKGPDNVMIQTCRHNGFLFEVR
jgi:hypothetical protein